MSRSLIPILCCLLFLTLSRCKNKMALSDDGIPSTLVIGAFVGEGPEEFIDRYAGVEKYLQKKLGMKVNVILTTDYTSLIESLRSKKIHMAYLSPFAYVLSYNRGDYKPIITIGDNGKPYTYRSIIVTHKNSGLKSMQDVKAKSKELTLSFTDPASTSGHLIPRAYLTLQGLDPATAFRETLFASSHAASVMTVHSGKIDIGCTYQAALHKLITNGSIKKGEIITLWTSDPAVNSPIVVRTDINEDFVKRIQEAYLEFPKEDSVGWQNYLSQLFTNTENLDYNIAYDSMYNGIREIMNGITDLKLVNQ
jgi:phosphonate transport system substrate-binding protein